MKIIIKMYTSAKTVLSTILLNSDTDQILDEYIISYMKLRPHLLSRCISEQGLYHIYVRSEDYGGDTNTILIKSFALEKEAKKYVIEQGVDVLDNGWDDYGTSVLNNVLMIIYQLGQPVDMYNISLQKYPTYAFSPEAYQMLCKEYTKNYGKNTKPEDADWLFFIK